MSAVGVINLLLVSPIYAITKSGVTSNRPDIVFKKHAFFASILPLLKVVHSEDRPFRCEVCDKGFRRKYDKNRHVALVHVQKSTTPTTAASQFSLESYLIDMLQQPQFEKTCWVNFND